MKKIILFFVAVFVSFLFASPAKAGGSNPERERKCFELLDIKGPMLSEVEEALYVCKVVLPPSFYAIYEKMANEYFEEAFREAKVNAIGKAIKETQAKWVKPETAKTSK